MLNNTNNATVAKNSNNQSTYADETGLVSTQNGSIITNSLLVAEKFGKQHKNVLTSIKNLIETANNSTGSKLSSFYELSSYIDSKGEARPFYIMNRDGFSLLVMGFTGKQAMQFKIEFIEAFNRMEQALKQREATLSPAEQLLRNAQLLVQQEQRLNKVEEKVLQIEAKQQTRPNYFTIVGYGTLNGISVNLKQASSLGRRASELCKKRGVETDKIPDPRFGTVKMYPAVILNEVFNQDLTRKGGSL